MPDPSSLPGPPQRPTCTCCAAIHSWSGRVFLYLFVLVSIVELFGTWTPAQKRIFEGVQILLLIYVALVIAFSALRAYRAGRHPSAALKH